MPNHLRRLGSSDLMVSSVGFGCWPMAGITSIIDSTDEVHDAIVAALDAGVNFFDTAYSYGYAGESDALLRRALAGRRHQAILASKAGMHWDANRQRVLDSSRKTLLQRAEEVLQRLGVENLDLFYLHTPDGRTPIEESAEAVAEIIRRGWARYAAVSNVDLPQAQAFHAICPVVAIQPYFNMLQQAAVRELREFCLEQNIALVCYWVLMKGLLAGHLSRHHQFDPRDRRLNYDIFRGESWERNQDLVDELRTIANDKGCTVSQLVIAWTLAQPGITVALCGAKRPAQILENAGGMHVQLDAVTLANIDACIARRGELA
jgi:aryl-alcohol dehydrogenase-like predicted oxidoreductase